MTAKIVAVFNQKGGCGKSTTTMQLAGAMGLAGLKVFVIDMDPQITSALWALQATADTPFPADVMSFAPFKEDFLSKIPPIAQKYDVIFIDCPPALESRVPWAALTACDLALIPVVPVMDNIWASKQAEELVFEARKARKNNGDDGPQAAYLLSMLRRGKIFEGCIEDLRQRAKLPFLTSSISMRNVFPESQLYGAVAKSFGTSAGSKEVDNVAIEVCKLLKLKFKKV